MKPLDPRLLKAAKSVRPYILFISFMGLVISALVISQAFLISWAATPIVMGTANFSQVAKWIWAIALLLIIRFIVIYGQESVAHKAARKIIIELRQKILNHSVDIGERWINQHQASPIVTLATRGIENLEPYFIKYLPQLFLSITVTPLTALVILQQDLISFLLIIFCIPLIPIFMILIGLLTQSFAKDKLQAMQRQGAQLLDLIAGLPTLKSFGRELAPARKVAELGRSYTRTTMQTLRVAFISGAALEFISILCTALVAVEVGFRLVYGNISLTSGLIIIMLTPEVYKPLREVGAQFHASADGVAAANEVFAILEARSSSQQSDSASFLHDVPAHPLESIHFKNLTVEIPDRNLAAPYKLNTKFFPGQISILAGPSGSGKSTAVQTLLQLVAPTSGSVNIKINNQEFDLSKLNSQQWFQRVTWVAQRPAILPGTVLANLNLENFSNPLPVDSNLEAAAQHSDFASVVADLPHGWNTQIGLHGVGISVGQRQRLALCRALYHPKEVVIFDEPTAHLDARSEQAVINTLLKIRDQKKIVIVIAHRNSLFKIADQIFTVNNQITQAMISDTIEVRERYGN